MIDKDEHKRQRQLVRCFRCGIRKERNKFKEESLKNYWASWCISCQNTPVGQFPNPFGER